MRSRRAAPVAPGAGDPSGDLTRLRPPLAPWLYAAALVLWASSWNLRLSVLMAWMPVEPVWVGTAAVALCVVHRWGQPLRLPRAVLGPVLVLAVGFLPGALLSSGTGYGPSKVAAMLFVLLPVTCAAVVLLDSAPARRAWVSAQAVVGVVVALAALGFHDPTRVNEPGRFTLATVDTISTARLIGVAVVVLLLLGLTSWRRRWWALVLAAVSAMVLVQVGSRGPLLAALLSVVLVVLVARGFRRRRLLLLLVAGAAGAGIFRYALADGGEGGRRIVASLGSGFADGVRARLLADAVRLGTEHPLGIGWGDFAGESSAGRAIANQGVAYAHNVFAEAFSEGGPPALLALVLVVLVALWRLQRLTDDPAEAVVLGTFVYWVLNAQVSNDIVGNRFLWIALACAVAAQVPSKGRDAPPAIDHDSGTRVGFSAREVEPITYTEGSVVDLEGGGRHGRIMLNPR